MQRINKRWMQKLFSYVTSQIFVLAELQVSTWKFVKVWIKHRWYTGGSQVCICSSTSAISFSLSHFLLCSSSLLSRLPDSWSFTSQIHALPCHQNQIAAFHASTTFPPPLSPTFPPELWPPWLGIEDPDHQTTVAIELHAPTNPTQKLKLMGRGGQFTYIPTLPSRGGSLMPQTWNRSEQQLFYLITLTRIRNRNL